MKLLSVKRTDVSVHESEPETRIIIVFRDDRKKDKDGHYMEQVSDTPRRAVLAQASLILQKYLDEL